MVTREELDRIEEEIQDEDLKMAFRAAKTILTYQNYNITAKEILKKAEESLKRVKSQTDLSANSEK